MEVVISKAGKLEMAERDSKIIDLMGKGLSCAEICKLLAPLYKVSEKSIQRQYYMICNEAVQGLSEEKKNEYRAEAIARSDYAYKAAIAEGNLKQALDATNLKAKLTGLYEKTDNVESKPTVINIQQKDFSASLDLDTEEAAHEQNH